MKRILLALIPLLVSCANKIDEPQPSGTNANMTGRSTYIQEEMPSYPYSLGYDVFGSYITEDLKDLIVVYQNHCFYYQEDCNKRERFDDWATWRIGRWTEGDDCIRLSYEDGGFGSIRFGEDSLIYEENGVERVFLPSGSIHIDVAINPGWGGSNNKEVE